MLRLFLKHRCTISASRYLRALCDGCIGESPFSSSSNIREAVNYDDNMGSSALSAAAKLAIDRTATIFRIEHDGTESDLVADLKTAAKTSESALEFADRFEDWWQKSTSRLVECGSLEMSLVIWNLGVINYKTNGNLRIGLSQDHTSLLESVFMTDSLLSPRQYATLFTGLNLLQATSDYYLGGFPCQKLISKTLAFFHDFAPSDAAEKDDHNKCLGDVLWKMSLCNGYPAAEDFDRLVPYWTGYWSGGGGDDYVAPFEKSSGADDPAERPTGLRLMDALVRHNQIAGAFLNWRLDPDRVGPAPADGGSSKDRSFWNLWYAGSKTLLRAVNLYKLDIHRGTVQVPGDEIKLLSKYLSTLTLITCTNCITVADSFDLAAQLFDARAAMHDALLTTVPGADEPESSDPTYARSICYVAFEDALRLFGIKRKSLASAAELNPAYSGSYGRLEDQDAAWNLLKPASISLARRANDILMNEYSGDQLHPDASFFVSAHGQKFERIFDEIFTGLDRMIGENRLDDSVSSVDDFSTLRADGNDSANRIAAGRHRTTDGKDYERSWDDIDDYTADRTYVKALDDLKTRSRTMED